LFLVCAKRAEGCALLMEEECCFSSNLAFFNNNYRVSKRDRGLFLIEVPLDLLLHVFASELARFVVFVTPGDSRKWATIEVIQIQKFRKKKRKRSTEEKFYAG
jgi:hypothetical protein